jgi:spoIIIJ-associated protein
VSSELQTEATGETVGEAKWHALRELERIRPGLDKSRVRFQVISEGERGLLGVGYAPARVIATVPDDAGPAPVDESEVAAFMRDLLDRTTHALGLSCRIEVSEDDDSVTASASGADLGLLIGRHGQTIDAVQYLASAIVSRRFGKDAKHIVVDAAGYRDRRRATLETIALQAAERARLGEESVELEPMTAPERKIVHVRLKDEPGVETESSGAEPNRYVVVRPAGNSAAASA